MSCEEKNRLAMEYDTAMSKFSEAVSELHGEWERHRRTNTIDWSELVTRREYDPSRHAWHLNNMSPPIVAKNAGIHVKHRKLVSLLHWHVQPLGRLLAGCSHQPQLVPIPGPPSFSRGEDG